MVAIAAAATAKAVNRFLVHPFGTSIDRTETLVAPCVDGRPLGGNESDAVVTPGASTIRTMRATVARMRSEASGRSAFARSATL